MYNDDYRPVRIAGRCTYLPRGGVVVKTGLTAVGSCDQIQFGIPPETIKDCMTLGIKIPTVFVVTGELFDRIEGVSDAEVRLGGRGNRCITHFSTTTT